MDQINQILNSYKISLALSFVGLVLIIGGIFSSNLFSSPQKNYPPKSIINSKSNLNLPATIKVDISGAVNSPGVYILDPQSRVEDAIIQAKGFSASASAEYISKYLNLSTKISDGMKIYIPFADETPPNLPITSTQNLTNSSNLIGINSASLATLESLPGIGPATAKKIIDQRPYQTLDELLTKKAVSRSVYDKIKDSIDLN